VAHRLALAEIAAGRAAEAVAVMQPMVDAIRAQGFQRHCWQQVALLAVAHIETGAAPSTAVHEAVRLMRGAGAMDWMASHLAEWLTQRSCMADAARVLGWAEKRQACAARTADAQSQAAHERALGALRRTSTQAQIDAWQHQGEAWVDDDVATVLLGVD
jgi:hypothetical protein